MPVLIPIVAAVAAYAGSAVVVGAAVTAGVVAAGSFAAIAVGVVAGAVIGAAVGAIGAAVTGGDIGKGALWGAVGGAVAGGFAGYGVAAGSSSGAAEGASTISASENAAANGAMTLPKTVAPATEAGMTAGEGTMYAAGITTAGQAVSGWAAGEAAEEQAKRDSEAAKEAREAEFAQRMQEIYANHESRMAEIGGQADNSLALADKNNAAAMEQLNTRIGHEKNTVATASEREDQKIAGFNESIRGTDENLFSRPTFNFNEANNQDIAFNSGFDEAVQASPNAPSLTPEELEILKNQQQAQAVA